MAADPFQAAALLAFAQRLESAADAIDYVEAAALSPSTERPLAAALDVAIQHLCSLRGDDGADGGAPCPAVIPLSLLECVVRARRHCAVSVSPHASTGSSTATRWAATTRGRCSSAPARRRSKRSTTPGAA